MQQGQLIIRPTSALLQRQTNFQIKMEPYCEVTIGQQKFRTKLCKNGGQTPSWPDEFSARKQSLADIIKFEIQDCDPQNSTRCAYIGDGSLAVTQIYNNRYQGDIQLTYQGQRNAGTLKVDVIFIPDQNQPQPIVQPQITQPTYPQNFQVLAQGGQDNLQLVQIVYRPLCYLCHGSGVYMKKGKKKQCFECAVAMGLCKKCFGTRFTRRGKRCMLCKGH